MTLPEMAQADQTAAPSDREWLTELQNSLQMVRPRDADCLIVAVGVRGPNRDCYDGNAIATVRMGSDEATSEALYLYDAVCLARGKILREREARARAAAKARAEKVA